MCQATSTAGQVVMIPPQSGQQAQQAVTTSPNSYMALAITVTIICAFFNLLSLFCGIPAIIFASMVSITRVESEKIESLRLNFFGLSCSITI